MWETSSFCHKCVKRRLSKLAKGLEKVKETGGGWGGGYHKWEMTVGNVITVFRSSKGFCVKEVLDLFYETELKLMAKERGCRVKCFSVFILFLSLLFLILLRTFSQ